MDRKIGSQMHYQQFAQLASQMAHDIRSPLAALDVLIREPTSLDLSKDLLQIIVSRIQGIADSLLDYREKLLKADDISIYPIMELIEPVVLEKKISLKIRDEIQIEVNIKENGVLKYIRVSKTEFQRVLSNLLNNSIEATQGFGNIRITIGPDSKGISISIKDSGVGIPEAILNQIQERGGSFGKASGHGLGLKHAISTVRSWGGNLQISSKLGVGTIVTLSIPTLN